MKNVLIISGHSVYPADTGGHVHTAGIAQALARLGYIVRIYSLAGRREDYGLRNTYAVREIEPGLIEEVHLGLFYGVLQSLARRLGLPRRWLQLLMRWGWVPQRLKQALREADVILCNHPHCVPVPGPWLAKPWLLISHNLEHKLLAIGTFAERRHVRWMLGLEQRAPQVYQGIMACAQDDQAFFRQHDLSGQLPVPLVGSAVTPSDYVVPPDSRERIRSELGVDDDERLLVFSGSRFGPNLVALEALKAFAAEQREWLLANRLRFLILGSMEPAAYRDGALIVTGRVPEIAPYFAAADAGLNPVTVGSGANVKLFEYLAAQLPVISTRFGVRGTELVAGLDYLEFEPTQLKPALESFISHDRRHWQQHSAAVWARHEHVCDMRSLVVNAIKVLPGFAGTSDKMPA